MILQESDHQERNNLFWIRSGLCGLTLDDSVCRLALVAIHGICTIIIVMWCRIVRPLAQYYVRLTCLYFIKGKYLHLFPAQVQSISPTIPGKQSVFAVGNFHKHNVTIFSYETFLKVTLMEQIC